MPTRDEHCSFRPFCGGDPELTVDDRGPHFTLWSPDAQAAEVRIYDADTSRTPAFTLLMQPADGGIWRASVPERLYGKFYTFVVTVGGRRLGETPGIWAKATGVNGLRAAIIDLAETNPEGWNVDKGPAIASITDAVIYELHYRDFSVHPSSGIVHKGKFLALTEHGTKNPDGAATGIDHLIELGVTHVQIMPSFDFNSVDESPDAPASYNWGYDPQNYNTPEGSYSTDASDPAARIREMKLMIKALHDAGIGVVMDVVYNHTASAADSCFSLMAPGYFYRLAADGSYSNASGCGNETASERAAMRRFIVNSVKYWAREYHIDGFRFDLMAIHDIDTMNLVAEELRAINPRILIYGEGWTADESPLPPDKRASKENIDRLNGIAVFADDLRDAVKGNYAEAADRGFVTGKQGCEEAVRNGIVAAKAEPTQIINYVSCHDDYTLTDKLALSMPDSTLAARQRTARLAQTIVFTSQGTPFIAAGEEVFRDKKGVCNSYKSPDSINAIDWTLKTANKSLFVYYRELIRLRRSHPAFRMTSAAYIARNIAFDEVTAPGVVAYSILNNANGDEWKEIRIVFNGSPKPYVTRIPKGEWKVVARDGELSSDGIDTFRGGSIVVAPVSALILALIR